MNKYELLKLLIAFLLGMIASQITGGKVEGLMGVSESVADMVALVHAGETATGKGTKVSGGGGSRES